ncbi:MAG: carbon storage regulator [Planctomycetes bacterium]|nr:carbon storage regulator [Planctomycetota bacterium]
MCRQALSRKQGESIRIGSDISITVVAIRGNAVRVGIAAPRSIPITRPDAKESRPRDRNSANATT